MGLIFSNHITVQTGHRAGSEVSDVFRQFQAAYERKYGLSWEQRRAVEDIMACRTAALGGCVYECGECGALHVRYCSCRNRNCPKCEKFKRAQWVCGQRVWLLPVPYFHVTFTTDHGLNRLFGANRRVLYDALFWSVKVTLQEMAGENFGGQLGITCALHSWGQKLDPHVHVHCIVTGGALRFDQRRWVRSNRRFLFDVKELSRRYRNRLCRKIKRLWKAGELRGCEGVDVAALLAEIRGKKWEVYAKPFADPENVIEYLSRYVHATAISNYRILKIAKGKVHFEYHDDRGGGKKKVLVLGGVEFMRRFLWHVVPSGFRRIRHFGLHHPSVREKLMVARALLGLERALPEKEELSLKGWLAEILGEDAVDVCAKCGAKGSLFLRGEYAEFSKLTLFLVETLGIVGRKVPAQGRA
jgi:hypothetical protein